jgi:glyoxylase-like metal-dependent hydrolase (beta-lactamase superfamily II)
VVVAPTVACFRDTCNVYVLRSSHGALLIDFGSGDVLDAVEGITDVLVTHFHRDQVQGLARAVESGVRVWVPPTELDFFRGREPRSTWNDYDLREDRFALLDAVAVEPVSEYRTRRYGGVDVYALPTPGHTLGSTTYLIEVEGRRLAFTGDLVYGDGQAWSAPALQWTYSGVEGWAATIVSCGVLAASSPDVLMPSHGEPIEEPGRALDSLAGRMQELIDLRLPTEWNVRERLQEPFDPITPHFLRNRTMFANNYALVSETGAVLLIDFGYDLTCTVFGAESERAARRTLLWSLEGLQVEAVLVTHYHDDHVAGINLLREITGAQAWIPENVAPVLADPGRYDLPCLWFEPVPADRVLPLGEPVRWHEYELTVYALPGHTRYAAAICVDVDGRRVLVTGDQQTNEENGRAILNYQYRNLFDPHDFVRSAELYAQLRPDLIVGGHWLPQEVTDEYLDRLLADARRTEELHAELAAGFGTAGFAARIEPYRAAGPDVELAVTVQNPFDRNETASVRLVVPHGWSAEPAERELALAAGGEATAVFRVAPTAAGIVLADVTIGETRFGRQAQAFVER